MSYANIELGGAQGEKRGRHLSAAQGDAGWRGKAEQTRCFYNPRALLYCPITMPPAWPRPSRPMCQVQDAGGPRQIPGHISDDSVKAFTVQPTSTLNQVAGQGGGQVRNCGALRLAPAGGRG